MTATEHENVLLLIEAREAARSGRARRVRVLAGLSQQEVADACGVDSSAVSRWEAGLRTPHGTAALAYARLLRALATA
jgi:transcriptional regulator with XRE-family HTH domain